MKSCVHSRLATRLLTGLEAINEVLDPEVNVPDATRIGAIRTLLNTTLASTVDLAVEVIAAEITEEMLRRRLNLQDEKPEAESL